MPVWADTGEPINPEPHPEQWAIDVGESLLDGPTAHPTIWSEPTDRDLVWPNDYTLSPNTGGITTASIRVMGNTWYQWNTTATTSATTMATTWNNWTTTYTGTWAPQAGLCIRNNTIATNQIQWLTDEGVPREQVVAVPGRTPDEWAEIQARQDAAQAERDKVNAAARAQGARLLDMILDGDQRQDLKALRYFDVIGSSGQRWRIRWGTSGNVLALDERGEIIMAICAHPAMWDEAGGYLPTEDVLAAQALHLIHDDVAFLHRANVHRGSRHHVELAPALRAA